MICRPEESSNYNCCAMNKKCDGVKCMAWRWQMEENKDTAAARFPRPPELRQTGHGYCGLARR